LLRKSVVTHSRSYIISIFYGKLTVGVRTTLVLDSLSFIMSTSVIVDSII